MSRTQIDFQHTCFRANKYLQLRTELTCKSGCLTTQLTSTVKRNTTMLTFKQWLVRKYGIATIKTSPKTVTKSSNSTPLNTRSGTS